MSLSNVLHENTIGIGLVSDTKEGIIAELVGILAATGKVSNTQQAISAVLERERSMSTGMKNGIAVPHGRTVAVQEMIACVGISKNPVPFESFDKEPARIFIMTLSPPDKTGPHLQFLAEVSRLFKSESKREALLAATTKKEILEIMTKN